MTARFAPRFAIYVTSARLAHRHAACIASAAVNDNWEVEAWQ